MDSSILNMLRQGSAAHKVTVPLSLDGMALYGVMAGDQMFWVVAAQDWKLAAEFPEAEMKDGRLWTEAHGYAATVVEG